MAGKTEYTRDGGVKGEDDHYTCERCQTHFFNPVQSRCGRCGGVLQKYRKELPRGK